MSVSDITRESFAKTIVTFTEQRMEERKSNIKKLSFTSFFVMMLILSLVSVMYLGYFDFNHDSFTLFVESHTKSIFFSVMVSVGCLGVLVFKPRSVNKSLYISIPVVIIFFIFSFIIRGKLIFLGLMSTIIIAAGVGIIASATLLLFIYSLNSTERLVSSIFMVSAFVIYFMFDRALSLIHPYLGSFVLPLLIMCALYLTLFLVDPYDVTELEVREEKLTLVPLMALVVMVAIYIIFTAIFTGIKVPTDLVKPFWQNVYFYIGVFLGLVVVVFLHFFNRHAIFFAWIIWTFFTTISYQLGISALLYENISFLYYLMYIAIGFANIVGAFTSIMMVGKLFEDKTHDRALKVVAIILGIFLLISRVVVLHVRKLNVENLFTVMQFVALFMSLGVVSFIIYAFFQWRRRPAAKIEPVKPAEPESIYVNPYNVLTPKETKVFELLLMGLTLRQIAGELKMKYDAVNFHYKNIYKKLDVNSKIELILRYGQKI